jgi:hypothetical protein
METATINAKGDRVFSQQVVERLSIFPIATWQTRSWSPGSGKKMIRAAHAKEKQRIQEHVQPPESP